MSHRFTVTTVLAAATIALLSLVAVQAQVRKASPTAVAIVDVSDVFNNLDERNAIKADLQKLADDLKAEQEGLAKEVEQLREDLKFMDKSQKGYEDMVGKIERKQVYLQGFTQYAKAKIERENVLRIELVYNKMRKTIEEVAQADGYQIVVFKEPAGDDGQVRFPGMDMQGINRAIEMRKIVWASDDVDITRRVTTKMNNEFKLRP